MTSSSILTLDDFHFGSNGDHQDYGSGDYHPIVVGDILGPILTTSERGYRIVHKLGYGSYLYDRLLAQKIDSSNAFVAVKVTTAEPDGRFGRKVPCSKQPPRFEPTA